MVSWVRAVVEFSGVLDEVAPLQNKVEELEERARVLEAEADEYDEIIADLEAKIASFKVEYASLIAQIESIKVSLFSSPAFFLVQFFPLVLFHFSIVWSVLGFCSLFYFFCSKRWLLSEKK